jgi:hypothetical protein
LLGQASLAAIATCPDELRAHDRDPANFRYSAACARVFGTGAPTKTDNWHFIDLDVAKPDPSDAAIDTFCANDCVVAKILAFLQVLASPGDAHTRLQALSFVVHFVGDVHQPLHAAERNNDHGGNALMVELTANGRHNVTEDKLHAVWDTTLIKNVSGDEVAFVAGLGSQLQAAGQEIIPPAQFTARAHQWARDSLDLARSQAYKDRGVDIPASPIHLLSPAYETTAEGIVRLQIARAGVRLAAFLNEALKTGH